MQRLFFQYLTFSPTKKVEPTTHKMPTLTREDTSFLSPFDTQQHRETLKKYGMHIVYGMIETIRRVNAEMQPEM